MKRWLKIQKEPIPETELLQQRSISNGIGAVIYFLGTVREREGEGEIAALDYEAFRDLDRAGLGDAAHVVTAQVDQHQVLGPLLGIG